eukprot:TRINITY_DN7419_c0_g1_i1.p1 TRINITY_DN7419_c0_g1~~TRINITY_DN7419_c0_g1_i1.p1  ORF type:complete len:208 (-),score=26.07 TRINITY_DN7419_c0_g1_i1:62-685(-)
MGVELTSPTHVALHPSYLSPPTKDDKEVSKIESFFGLGFISWITSIMSIVFSLQLLRRKKPFISLTMHTIVIFLCTVEFIAWCFVPAFVWAHHTYYVPKAQYISPEMNRINLLPPGKVRPDNYARCFSYYSGSIMDPDALLRACNQPVPYVVWIGWIAFIIFWGIELTAGIIRLTLIKKIARATTTTSSSPPSPASSPPSSLSTCYV